jgi:hypothetical protein
MKNIKSIAIVFLLLFSQRGSAQGVMYPAAYAKTYGKPYNCIHWDNDSTDAEIARWRKTLPFCDSVRRWYYHWSFSVPNGSASGWGEDDWCRWTEPTKAEVFRRIKAQGLMEKKWERYTTVDYITEFNELPCPCQERKRGF